MAYRGPKVNAYEHGQITDFCGYVLSRTMRRENGKQATGSQGQAFGNDGCVNDIAFAQAAALSLIHI